jgi:hypothetical protein
MLVLYIALAAFAIGGGIIVTGNSLSAKVGRRF